MSILLILYISSLLGSILAIALSIGIFKKVYQQEYRKPWIFIGLSSIFLATAQIIYFFQEFYPLTFVDISNELITTILEFVGVLLLAYGLSKEYQNLKSPTGKYVKIKFIPVQEENLGGELDINISKGISYIGIKKDKEFLLKQFSKATKKGFEGFLFTETPPTDIREEFSLQKTPIGWISQLNNEVEQQFIKAALDENSDIIDPIQLNNWISYIDNFLSESKKPFIFIELDNIFKVNNNEIVLEFLKYISTKIKNSNGILLTVLNSDPLTQTEKLELSGIFKELE